MSPPCPPLPTEIWSQVLSHVDNRTLWTSCRHVSPSFRFETEREVRRNRLPSLEIHWGITAVARQRYRSPYIYTTSISHFSNDGERVHYKTRFGYFDMNNEMEELSGLKIEHLPWKREALEEKFKEAVECSSAYGEDKQRESSGLARFWVTLEGLCSYDLFPGVEIEDDLSEVSFRWIEMLDMLA